MTSKQKIRKIMEINTDPRVNAMEWDYSTFRSVIRELHSLNAIELQMEYSGSLESLIWAEQHEAFERRHNCDRRKEVL